MHRRSFLSSGVRGLGALALLHAIGCERRGSAPDAMAKSAATPATNGHAPLRIVALSPAVGVTLIDLGLERFVVGRHAWDVALDPSLPACGDVAGFDAETLLALRPTHLLMEWGQRALPEPVSGFASRGGWDVMDVSPLLTLADVERMTRDVGERLAGALNAIDHEQAADVRWRARALGEAMRGAWGSAHDVAAARDAGLARAGRVLLLGATEPPGILGPGSFHHQLLVAMGATPALTEGKPWTEADAEDVLALKPDAILILAPRPFDRAQPLAGSSPQPPWNAMEPSLGALARLGIPAIERRRAAVLDHPLAHAPCARLVEVAREMRGVLSGWAPAGSTDSTRASPPDATHPPHTSPTPG